MMRFGIEHNDHGISLLQTMRVCNEIERVAPPVGLFILRIEIPEALGTVPCGLYGPAMGDAAVEEEDVVYWVRGKRPYADRCVDLPVRQVSYVHAIGTLDAGGYCTIHTIFGGALAELNPEDPKCTDKAKSIFFWSVHALCIPSEREG